MTKVFQNFDFEKDGYSITFKFFREKPQRELIISDSKVLKKMKKKWNFEKSNSIGRCGYNFSMQILKNGEVEAYYLACYICKRLIREKASPVEIFEIDEGFIQNFLANDKIFLVNDNKSLGQKTKDSLRFLK